MADPKKPPDENVLLDQARLMVSRLERISADSIWAHRSSGLRGSLFRCMDRLEAGDYQDLGVKELDLRRLVELTLAGFEMLESAARERVRNGL